jgi:hypothetical protein
MPLKILGRDRPPWSCQATKDLLPAYCLRSAENYFVVPSFFIHAIFHIIRRNVHNPGSVEGQYKSTSGFFGSAVLRS